ncbi:MAG: cyclic nucleotide-binding domain-containing protein [Actinobacteria bacterium]|nr:MAG: cyclic nucleotide-binding domain-containing protein [Actinomycetota bacterium]
MLHRNAKVDLIKQAPLFARCTKKEIEQVAQLADEIDLREGKELTVEGEPGREFFVLIEGTADVRRKGRRVNQMKDGDFFGEIALISGAPRTATVTATSPVRALVITDRDFRTLLKKSPAMQLRVLEALAERLPPETL